jgi:hypothetical protein
LAYSLFETFNGRLSEPDNYVAFLPAFFYAHPNSKDYETFFRWVELPTQDVPCVKSVKVVTEFSKTDILFDFFVPENPAYLKRGDLFQRVFIPLIGFI